MSELKSKPESSKAPNHLTDSSVRVIQAAQAWFPVPELPLFHPVLADGPLGPVRRPWYSRVIEALEGTRNGGSFAKGLRIARLRLATANASQPWVSAGCSSGRVGDLVVVHAFGTNLARCYFASLSTADPKSYP